MAITVTTDMFYTRPGEGDPSDVLSAHDPLIWEFEDGAISPGPATATVEFLIKDNAGSVIYTSDAFPAYLLDYSDPVAQFRFDATQIVKHIISTYFYKETSEVIEAENYGSEVEVRIKTFDNAVQEDSELLEYFGSHALNQIGDEYGSNIPRLFYNDTEEIAHFLGFPNHLFFFAPTTLNGEDPMFEILKQGQSVDDNIQSTLVNQSYDTFTSSGTAVTSAINIAGTAAAHLGSSPITVVAGEQYMVEAHDVVVNSGQAPSFVFTDGVLIKNMSVGFTAVDGETSIIVQTILDSGSDTFLQIQNSAAGNWSCGTIKARKIESGTAEGTLGLFMHTINLSLMQLSLTSILANMYSNNVLLKTWNITVFPPCNNSVYIRFLTKDGYYMYWAFSPFPFTSKQQQSIGNVINSFSEMALANSRNIPIGYRDSFERLAVAAASVPIVFRRKLMDLFTSPAVYLWHGKETPGENLPTSWENHTGSSPFETFESSGMVIIEAINTSGNGFAFSLPVFSVMVGDVIIVIFDFTLNSGALPNIRIWDLDESVEISNVENIAEGSNIIQLTITDASENAQVFIGAFGNTNFSTSKVIVKRAEVETDWIQLEGVEGSHNLREKFNADNFNATLVLPEKFTQQLSGQNL